MQLSPTTLAKIRRQNDVTRRDLPSRVVSVSTLMALCGFYTSPAAVAPLVVLYVVIEVLGVVIYRRMDSRSARGYVFPLLCATFVGSATFSAIVILLNSA